MFEVNYRPAVFKELQKNYVEWYVRNPETGEMVRFRKFLDSIRAVKHRRHEAARIVSEINAKLLRGWNPFLENPDNLQFSRLSVAVRKGFEHKTRISAESNKSTYRAREKVFFDWLNGAGLGGVLCSQFGEAEAMAFFDWLLTSRAISHRTYNNYLIDLRAVFNWLGKRGHFFKNPFLAVDKLRAPEVRKSAFSVDEQKRYSDYLRKNDFPFYMVSALVYYCALRPGTIAKLRVSDFLDSGFILVSGANVKTGRVQMVQVPSVFSEELRNYLAGYPGEYYFCGVGLVPGRETSKRIAGRMSERFSKHKKALGLADSITFYSLKDTGGERLIESGFNPKQIRDHMGHVDLSVTDKYIKTRTGQIDEKRKNEFPEF